jgi:ferredoxin-NADP reductase
VAWQRVRLVDAWEETPAARTLQFEAPDWPGHLAGQHVDVRLTAEDGYTAERSYSLSAPDTGPRIEITVQLVTDGEVSPYLVQDMTAGDELEVRGPLGGWFVWHPDRTEPALLVAGGSGVAPLVAMLRAHAKSGSAAQMRLIYSTRTPDDVYFADELLTPARTDVAVLYTRKAPSDAERGPHRIAAADLRTFGWSPDLRPTCYVCGPTPFVETVTRLLVDAGHDPARIRAERFGATGG